MRGSEYNAGGLKKGWILERVKPNYLYSTGRNEMDWVAPFAIAELSC